MVILRDRHLTAVEAINHLEQVRNANISDWTARRRLREVNLTSRKPATGLQLELHHKRARLNFAREHVEWTEEQWSQVLYTDESRFNRSSPDGRESVWRRPGERYSACAMSLRTAYGGGSVMVWCGISFDGRTDLVFVENGSLTAPRYIEEILLPLDIPYFLILVRISCLCTKIPEPMLPGVSYDSWRRRKSSLWNGLREALTSISLSICGICSDVVFIDEFSTPWTKYEQLL